jgi:hypothetical protein
MSKLNLTVDAGLKIASRHPNQCARILADNLYPLLDDADWFTPEWRLKFCAYFLQNLADGSIELEVDPLLLKRVRNIQLTQAIKLIENNPLEPGLKALVALICIELRCGQGLDIAEQYQFYNTLFGKFFPERKL